MYLFAHEADLVPYVIENAVVSTSGFSLAVWLCTDATVQGRVRSVSVRKLGKFEDWRGVELLFDVIGNTCAIDANFNDVRGKRSFKYSNKSLVVSGLWTMECCVLLSGIDGLRSLSVVLDRVCHKDTSAGMEIVLKAARKYASSLTEAKFPQLSGSNKMSWIADFACLRSVSVTSRVELSPTDIACVCASLQHFDIEYFRFDAAERVVVLADVSGELHFGYQESNRRRAQNRAATLQLLSLLPFKICTLRLTRYIDSDLEKVAEALVDGGHGNSIVTFEAGGVTSATLRGSENPEALLALVATLKNLREIAVEEVEVPLYPLLFTLSFVLRHRESLTSLRYVLHGPAQDRSLTGIEAEIAKFPALRVLSLATEHTVYCDALSDLFADISSRNALVSCDLFRFLRKGELRVSRNAMSLEMAKAVPERFWHTIVMQQPADEAMGKALLAVLSQRMRPLTVKIEGVDADDALTVAFVASIASLPEVRITTLHWRHQCACTLPEDVFEGLLSHWTCLRSFYLQDVACELHGSQACMVITNTSAATSGTEYAVASILQWLATRGAVLTKLKVEWSREDEDPLMWFEGRLAGLCDLEMNLPPIATLDALALLMGIPTLRLQSLHLKWTDEPLLCEGRLEFVRVLKELIHRMRSVVSLKVTSPVISLRDFAGFISWRLNITVDEK